MNDLTSAVVTLFLIMDPLGNIPLFLGLTGGESSDHDREAVAL